eukprot:TRINITY_DN2253_c0_g1_i1.p1 TRINITY_DN2253_c0_g1~~TRINITY_DN2253_c0_g1_i1.p1  ORF type:complete len:350 (-),score=43.17 TRINITY_DN2253_c0_g1_i1:82-1131(-)
MGEYDDYLNSMDVNLEKEIVASHRLWCTLLSLITFVPSLVVVGHNLIKVTGELRRRESRRRVHIKRVFILATAILLLRTIELLLRFTDLRYCQILSRQLPSLMLVCLLTYVIYIFYEVYSFLTYDERSRNRKLMKISKQLNWIALITIIMNIVPITIVHFTISYAANEEELDDLIFNHITIGLSWMFVCLSTSVTGIKLYQKMKLSAMIHGLNLDLSPLWKVVIVIVFVTKLKMTFNFVQIFFFFAAYKDVNLQHALWRADPIKISVSNDFQFSLGLVCWKLFPPFLELIPLFYLLHILYFAHARRRSSKSRKAINKFIERVDSAHSLRANSETSLDTTMDWERGLIPR